MRQAAIRRGTPNPFGGRTKRRDQDPDAALPAVMRVRPSPALTPNQSVSAGARRLPPALRFALIGIGAVAAIALAIVAVTTAILLSGATEVGILRDRVAAELSARLGPPFTVAVGRTVLRLEADEGLVAEIEDIVVRGGSGDVVAAVPSVRLAVDPWSLLALRVAVTEADIAEPKLALVRDAAGRIRLDGGAPAPDTSGAPAADEPLPGLPQLADGVAAADGAIADLLAGTAGAAMAVALRGGTVTIRDAVSGNVRHIADVAVTGRLDPGAGTIAADATARGQSGAWSASFSRRVEADSGDRVLSGAFSQMTLADLSLGVAGSSIAEIPLYGGADVVIDERGMRDASLRLDIGAGVLDVGGPEEAILLDEASLRARWDGAAGEIVVEPSSVHFGPSGGTFTGVVRDEGGGRYMFAFDSSDTMLAPRDIDMAPLAVAGFELSGSADLAARRLDVDRLVLQTGEGTLAAAIRLGFTGETPSLAVAAELTPMDIATWLRMWPPFIAPGARRWAIDNISAGRIASGRFDASVPAGVLFRSEPPKVQPETFRLALGLEDVTVATFGGLPPIVHGRGEATLAGATFGVDLVGGDLATSSGTVVKVTEGAFAIDDVFDPAASGVVEVELAGTARAVGELADVEPFRALARRDLAPADLSGDVEANVSVRAPLDLALGEDVAWKVAVRGKGLASAKPVEGRMFAAGDLTIVVAPDGVTIEGTAKIDGVTAAVSLSQPLAADGSNAGGAQQAAALVLDRDARLRLGLDIEDIVSGTIDAQVRSRPAGGGEQYELDFRRARLVLPGLGWSKDIGVPAIMRFDLRAVTGGVRAENIVFSGEGFGFGGSAEISDAVGLVSARLKDVRLRPGDDLAASIDWRDGAYVVTADGASFDLRGVLDELKGGVAGGEADDAASDITLDAKVRKLRGYNDRVINDATLAFVLRDGVMRKLAATGRLGGSPLSFDFSEEIERASVNVQAGNGGALLDYLDFYRRVGGGSLAIAGERPSPSGPLAGTFALTDFAILDEPAVREVVSRAKPRPEEKIDTSRTSVEQMTAVFRYEGDRVTIDDAFLRGTAMGATFNGYFDLAASLVSISGTYIPIFGINNVFSRVPVVGRILGGENSEGLIGVTFKVEGPLDSPRVFVNPLSAVAPGIFRKIFEFR
jgi:hypothetical protein